MEQKKLDELRGRLIATRDELKSVAARNEQELGNQLGSAQTQDEHLDFNHPADMVAGDPDYEKELNLLRRERAELSAVGDALDRIDKDAFGICEECGGEIAYDRLKAIPYTTHCADCQEMLDRRRR